MTNLPPSVTQLSREYGILNILQPYRPLRPVTGITLLLLSTSPHQRLLFREGCSLEARRTFKPVAIFWDIAPSLTSNLLHAGLFLRNVGSFANYTTLYRRTWHHSSLPLSEPKLLRNFNVVSDRLNSLQG